MTPGALLIAALLGSLGAPQKSAGADAAGDACASQDAPIRRRSEVEACGRQVVDRYSDAMLGEYGILDVTKSPYSADPSGRRDSTQALQRAMLDARDARLITYLPPGAYRVSRTLTCIQGVVQRDQDYLAVGREQPGDEPIDPTIYNESYFFPCVVMGSRSGRRSRIVLAPRSAGFGDPRQPAPVIHVWARSANEPWFPPGAWTTPPDSNQEYPPISFNNLIVDLDISLGTGNPGAIGIQHFGAQMSAIEDVTVDARGAFAGLRNPPAGGGGLHGVTVNAGRYGIYINVGESGLDSSQPVYVISNVTLRGQTEHSIFYNGRGPLTVVGAAIQGAGVRAESPPERPWDGAMSFVDSVFSARADACAISSNRSVFLRNVYFERSTALVCQGGEPQLEGKRSTWSHVEEYAAGATLQQPGWLGESLRKDPVYVDGRIAPAGLSAQVSANAPPADLRARHAWSPLPSWDGPGVANVRAARYGAKADGRTDDWPAIQRAIDENAAVFLPKGIYRLSRPLSLKSNTRLFGVSNVLSVLAPAWSPQFNDPNRAAPLVDTVDDASADTVLAFVQLRVPSIQPGVYALRWRAGRRSVVRDVSPLAALWEPGAPPAFHPMVQVTGSGGGRWYQLEGLHWWGQGPDYRHLLVEGASEPLAFYMLNPEHAASEAQVELRNARNVSIYSLKAEGQFTTLWLRNSSNVEVYGYGGVSDPRPNRPVFRIEGSDDFLLANIHPDHVVVEAFRKLPQWSGLGAHADPVEWILIQDSPDGSVATTSLRGVEQVVAYKKGKVTE